MTDDMEAAAMRHGKVLAREVAKFMREQFAVRDATIAALSKRIAELEADSELTANSRDQLSNQLNELSVRILARDSNERRFIQ